MATRRFKWTAAGAAVAALGLGLVGYSLIAAQGQGTLAQEPLATKNSSTPAFIMAVDDSGSMTFQTQFPGMDGEGCWNTSRRSFFDANGQLYTSGNCDYFYVLPGTRINNYYGIPPFDSLGFARSAAYNPTYFDPTIKYEPWVKDDGVTDYPLGEANALIDPRDDARVNLVSDYYSTAAADSFRLQTGMVIPANTFFRVGNTNYQYNTDVTWNGNVSTAYVRYWPATFYLPYTNDNDPRPQQEGAANVYANVTRTKAANACGAGCTMWKYTISGSNNNADALRNFATWYTYYGNRNRAMIAGMTRSLKGVQDLKVGYFRINQHGSYDSGTAANKRLAMRLMTDPNQKTALYKEMIALTASGGTPNRQAVNAASLQFTRTDTDAPIADSCQKNAVMLFTDGFSNGGGPTVGNNDGNMGAPFTDGHSDTMADIVTRFYVNNGTQPPLRPDLPAGKVAVPEACKTGNPDKSLDCQANLHLNFYGVTLGARGNLFNPDLDQNPYTDASIYGNWPPRENDQRSTVDDIWHASVNTRGEYINARTPVDITNAMSRVLQAVGTAGAPSSGTGASGARIGVGSISAGSAYTVKNEGTDWSSTLDAVRLSVDPTSRALVQTKFWEASAKLQAAAARKIFFTKGGTTREFKDANVTLDDLCTKTGQNPGMSECTATDLTTVTGATAATAVAYLRGDTSGEARNNGKLRDRSTRLGDIVNSTPVITSPIDDFGYRRLGGTIASSYQAYLNTKVSNNQYMVYVGANDGMLHAFNGGMNAAGDVVAGGGTEAFAYIPATALGHMGNLLYPYDPKAKVGQKKHKYYVDGQIAVADSYYGGAWHTTLVGASGAGGRSVFGLDVTQGGSFGTTSKLWEISDIDTNLSQNVRNNIGFVLGKPVIVPVLEGGNPTWKAIFGNGFNSANGKAVLFVVDIATGAARMIEAVETGTGVPTGTNGLASIVVIDRWGGTGQNERTRDGYSDTVYGTDQKGALWKFDLRSSSNTLATPLFTTLPSTDKGLLVRQPITGGITAGTGNNGGVMLYFGTGSFWFTEDPKDNSLQSLYAVNDLTSGPISTTLTRANLSGYTANIVGSLRTLTAGTPPANSRGWYVDLALRERFVGNPSLSNGILYMPTYIPRDPANAATTCAVPGDNWLFGLTPLTGTGALGRASLGSPTGAQYAVGTAGFKSTSEGGSPITNANSFALPRQSPPALGDGGGGGGGGGGGAPPNPPGSVCVGGVQFGPDTLYIPYPCGRQSWRQIQ